jgi:transcriptional regulator with XRE-family HTH domain
MSQASLAAKFAQAGHSVSQPTISQIARGRFTKPPSKRTVAAFADVLGIQADWWTTAANDSTNASTTEV